MPHKDIYKEPVFRTFRATECSWAAFYIKLVNIFRYFLPILIIFLTDGIWKKTNTFREVPDVSFTGDFIVYAFGHERSIVASSFAVLNSAASPDQLSTSQILHRFTHSLLDDRRSEVIQVLDLQFQMSTQNLSINTLIYGFVLRVKLNYHSIIDMELLLTDTLKMSSPTSRIQTTAQLLVDQSTPFEASELFRVIDRRRQDVEHFQIQSVLRRIAESPVALEMKRSSTLLLSAPSPPSTISIDLSLAIPGMEFIYKTGFWELLKWFWIQYFAAFVIVDYLFSALNSYLFGNRVFYVNDVVR